MLLAVHATVGALIGNAAGGPAAAFSLSFLSHFFLDMVPHGDDHLYIDYKSGRSVRKAMLYTGLDVVTTTLVVVMLFLFADFNAKVNAIAGIIGGVLPDALVGLGEALKPKGASWFGRRLNGFCNFHMWNHHLLIAKIRDGNWDIPLRYGFVMQALVLVVLIRVMV
ncbi:hypothetical protein ACFL26_01280 [Patescibacteria group bacterium]